MPVRGRFEQGGIRTDENLLRPIQAISGKRSEKFSLKREMVMDEVPDMVRTEAPTLKVRSSGKVSRIKE